MDFTMAASLVEQNMRLHLLQTISIISALVFSDAMLHRRRNPLPMLWFIFYRIVIIGCLFSDIFPVLYGQQSWFYYGNIIAQILNILILYTVLMICYEDRISKIFVVLLICETMMIMVTLFVNIFLNYLEGYKNLLAGTARLSAYTVPCLLLDVLFIAFLYTCFRFLFDKIKDYRIKSARLLIPIAVIYYGAALCSTSANAILKEPEKTKQFLLMSACSSISAFIWIMVFWSYRRNIQRMHTYLLAKQKLLKSNYLVVLAQIREAEEKQKEIDMQMCKIENLDSSLVDDYMRELRARYQEVSIGIYCNDRTVDALLNSLVYRCRKKKIVLQIGFQGFERGCIEENDLFFLMNQLMEDILLLEKQEASTTRKFTLKSRQIKNELIILAIWDKGQLKKKVYAPILKKYHGSWHQSKGNEHTELTMLLQNGGEK